MSRPAAAILLTLFGTTALVVSALAGGLSGPNRAAAQAGTPAATPSGEPSCTADLGIVRSTKTCVNIVHAFSDAPPVDLLLNGQLAVEGLAYGTASGFLSVPAGSYDARVVPSGEGPEAAVIVIAGLELVAGRAYEIGAIGSPAGIAVSVNPVDVYAVEGTSQAGSTRIRLINAAVDVAAVDLDVIGDDIATRQFSEVGYAEASDYTVIAAGTYQVRVTETAGDGELVLLPGFRFERDTVTSLYVIGAMSDDTLMILPVTTRASRLPAPATPEASPAS